jgi:hypothetical protein
MDWIELPVDAHWPVSVTALEIVVLIDKALEVHPVTLGATPVGVMIISADAVPEDPVVRIVTKAVYSTITFVCKAGKVIVEPKPAVEPTLQLKEKLPGEAEVLNKKNPCKVTVCPTCKVLAAIVKEPVPVPNRLVNDVDVNAVPLAVCEKAIGATAAVTKAVVAICVVLVPGEAVAAVGVPARLIVPPLAVKVAFPELLTCASI